MLRKLSVGGPCTKRTLAESLKLFSEVDGISKTVEETKKAVTENSMYATTPALAMFPFPGTRGSVGVYAIFWIEPMHTIPLSVSRLIE